MGSLAPRAGPFPAGTLTSLVTFCPDTFSPPALRRNLPTLRDPGATDCPLRGRCSFYLKALKPEGKPGVCTTIIYPHLGRPG